MKDKAKASPAGILRQKAEDLLSKKAINTSTHYSDIEIFKLVHELDVHQVELEMQNEELLIAKRNAEADAEKYTILYDFAPSGYFTLSKIGEILEVNLRGASLLGKERSFLIDRRFALFISDETRPKFNLFLEEIFDSNTRQTCELKLSIASEFSSYVHLSGIVNEDGEECLITMIDISQRIKAEKALKVSEDKYRTLFETNRDSITIFRIDKDDKPGNFIEVNPATTTLFGFTKKELLSMSVRDLETLSDKKRKARIDTLLLTGKVDFETVVKNKKGNLRNVDIETILINYLNEPAVMNITRDITERKQNEINIKKAQENLVTILEAIPDLLFEVDLEGRIYHYQSHRDDLLAVAPHVFMGKLFHDVLPVDVANIILKTIEETNKKGWSIGNQYSLDIPKHGKHWFELSGSTIKESSDKGKHFILLARDITQRKLAELALENEKRRLAVILIGTGAGTWEWNIQTGETIFNERWAEILGYTLEELAPISIATWQKYTHPDDLKNSTEILDKIFKGELDYYECEVRMKHKNGNWVWILDSGKINQWDKEGKPLFMSGTHQDVTERKLAEINVQESKNILRAVLDNAPVGIWMMNENGKMIFVNKSFCNSIGISEEQFTEVPDYSELYEPKVAASCKASDNEALTKNESNTSYEKLLFTDGKIHDLEIIKRKIVDEHTGTKKLIGIAQDITERKLAEKAKEDALNLFNNITLNVPGVVYQYLLRPDGSSCFPYASEGIKEIYRVTPEEVREDASKVFENIHPDYYEAVVASIQKSAKELTHWKHEYCVKYKDGVVRYLYGNAKPQKLEDGSVLWHGYITDISENKIIENSLRESEEKYRGLVENSPDGVVIYKDGTIVFANEEAFRMIGAKNKNSFIGKPVLQFIHPNSTDSISRRMKEVIKDKKSTEIVEEKFIRLDGTPFDVELKAIPTIFDHQEAVQVIVHDITQRKKSALELTKINRVYALISQINNLIIRTHSQKELFQEICNISVAFGKFRMSWIGLLDDNHKILTEAFAGYEEGYFTKSNITTIANVPEGRGPTGIAMREARTVICNDIANDDMMKPWRKDALERGYQSSISIPIIVRNKIIGAFNLYSAETYFFTSEEEILLLEKIILNISFALEKIQIDEDRKRTEEKIRQLSQAVEQSPVSILITNTDGEIEYANPKFLESTGYSLHEVIGQNPRIVKSGHTSLNDYKDLWQTLIAGKEWHGEFHNKRKDGTLYWESATISPIINAEGKTTHFIAIKEDITHRKIVEKQLIKSKERAEESDRLKLAFLANMSHEIRTPMNGILGFTELLKEPHLSGEEQQEYINIIEKSGKRMLNIINDIISISKVESGQIEISLSETNINEQLEYIHTFFKPETKLKGIELVLSKKLAAKDDFTNTDKEKLYAILTNLAKNAIKFTNSGSIEFGCEKKGKYLEFFVKDTGMGISKSQQKLIFERFRQVSETISRSHEGSGLGLAISKAYVEMLGGKIWVKSKEGKGSTFYFTIPLNSEFEYIPREKDVAEEVGTGVKEENKIKDLKVLIVEDDAISKLLITIAVKPYSKEIIKVSTGFEAIDACRKNPDIDLVMMDINMPEMGGYEATNLIREFNKDLVIIAQTANGMQSDRDNAIAAGCTDYISKPININSLGALIQKYFKK